MNNSTYICPFCNRDVRVTAPPNKAEDKWEVLKKEIETFILRVETVPFSNDTKSIAVSSFKAILGAMEELENK